MMKRVWLACIVWALLGASAFAANYPLQVSIPRAAGTTPDVGHTTISSAHRIFWAYPGILYEIQAAVVGGKPPYTYSLPSGAPAGMTIHSSTGVISWTATGNGTSAGPITFRVVDAELTQVDTTWSISVDQSRFKFINADYSGTETGTISQPYNAISDVSGLGTNLIFYLRGATGTYNFRGTGTYHHGGSLGQFRYININATSSHSVQFLAYPGDSRPIIDMGKGYEPILYSGVDTTTNQFTTGRWGDIWVTGDPVEVQARRCTYNGSSCTSEAAGTLPSPLTGPPTLYYIRRVDSTHITLHPTLADATNNTNVIDITTTGDSGTLDNYTILGGSPYWKTSGGPVYYDGLAFRNMPNKGLNFINDTNYRVVRNNTFTTQYGGGNGMNSGMIDHEGNTTCPDTAASEYAVYQGNTFNGSTDSSLVKIYAHWKLLIEGNTFMNSVSGSSGVAEGLALKGGCMTQATVRSNVIHDIETDGLAGNNNTLYGGEYLYNVVYNVPARALRLNQNESMTQPFYIERNSFCGPIELSDTVSAGNFNFVQNVIVNSAGGGASQGVTLVTSDFSHRILTNNLTGVDASGIVDATCKLQGSYRTTWLGTRGYESAIVTTTSGMSGGARFVGTVRVQ